MLHDQPLPLTARRQILAVAAGGAVGTGARYAVATAFAPPVHGLPWPTLGVNVVGSLLLGLAVGLLDRPQRSPLLRPFLVTGVLGAFTTYSTFAVETNHLLATRPPAAAAYVALSVLGGLAAAWVGLRLAQR